jgi:mycothiol synthase
MNCAVRPYRDEDVYQVPNLLRRCLHADPISNQRFLSQVVLDPNFDPEGADDSHRGYITLACAHPERVGLGSLLLGMAEDFLRRRGRSEVWVSPYAPGYFMPGVDVAAYPGALEFFSSRGYEEVYRPLAMETSLWPEPRLAFQSLDEDGLYVGPFGPTLTLALLEFVREEFPGDWVRVVREAIAAAPERLLVAVRTEDDGSKRVVGFSHFDRERFGPIGVSSGERGKRIGQRLMVETLRAQREQGYRTSWFLWSDDRTAVRLYDHAGFNEVRRFAVLKKTL